MKLVHNTEGLKRRYTVSYMMLLNMLPLAPSTYRRWRLRVRHGEDPIRKPGPKPLRPLDLQLLYAELDRLVHGRKRSRNMGAVQTAVKDCISRRDLAALVEDRRKQSAQEKRAAQFTLCWRVPRSVWSMDVSELRMFPHDQKVFVLGVQDLASGYKLPPLVTKNQPSGGEISAHLHTLFKRFGRPLFFKRDNGGNLNQGSVNEMLAESYVLPLNSPGYYAPYNGAVERAHGELKYSLKKQQNRFTSFSDFTCRIELAVHELNHGSRRKLGGRASCGQFFGQTQTYTKRKRKEVFLWIYEQTQDIVEKAARSVSPASAWRIACRIWLVKNGLLIISKRNEVLLHFNGKSAHY